MIDDWIGGLEVVMHAVSYHLQLHLYDLKQDRRVYSSKEKQTLCEMRGSGPIAAR